MVLEIELDDSLDDDVGVENHELVVYFVGDLLVGGPEVSEDVEKIEVCLLVIASVHFLGPDGQSYFAGLRVLLQHPVHFVGVVRVFGMVVVFAHDVGEQRGSQMVVLLPADHFDGPVQVLLAPLLV